MSPEKAKIFMVEDDQRFLDLITKFLEKQGHSVVLKASTLQDALAGIDLLRELEIDVAIVDGNLDKDDFSGYDGQEVLRMMREKAPNVKTVGMGGNPVPGTDVDLGKMNIDKIAEVVKSL